MYIPVFLTIRGNLLITPSQSDWCGYRFTFRSASLRATTGSSLSGGSNSTQVTHLRGIARKMLWYPIAYIVLLLPTAVCRFRAISGLPVPFPVLMGCILLLSCMGTSNVCIYFFTRNLSGIPWSARPLPARQEDGEIFVEWAMVSEAGRAPGRDDGPIQHGANHRKGLSATLWHLDVARISSSRSSSCLGGDIDPEDIGARARVEEEELPLPTSNVCTSSHEGASGI
jgi:hypothetical protein